MHLFKMSALAALGATVLVSAAMAQEIDTLRKIKESGTIHIGNRDSSVPFSYKPTGSGDPVGFSNDICLRIVDAVKAKLGLPALRVQYTLLNSLNRIPLIQNGTVDLDCATTTNSVTRQQQVAFAPSHFVTNITVAVKKKSGITSLADLAGKSVATVAGRPRSSCCAASAAQKTWRCRRFRARTLPTPSCCWPVTGPWPTCSTTCSSQG